jgi:hypothetical protein
MEPSQNLDNVHENGLTFAKTFGMVLFFLILNLYHPIINPYAATNQMLTKNLK